MKIGAHVSISGSLDFSIDRAIEIGCDTFQIFTRNPRSWKPKKLSDEKIIKFKKKLEKANIKPIFSHIPYLVNLASPDEDKLLKSIEMMKEELVRCEKLNIPYIVTHLGSAKKKSKKFAIEQIISSLNNIFEDYNGNSIILLENTAGKKNKIGENIEEICHIIKQATFYENIGLCFDTCHAFASGYDLRKVEVIDEIVSTIDDLIGIEKLLCIHCNDSVFDLGEGRDRHAHIGLGNIGEIGFENLMKNKEIRKIPFICETPVDEVRNDKENINYLRKISKNITKK